LPFVPNTNGCANGKRANCEVGRFAGIAGTFTLWRGRATTMSEPTLFANVELSAPGTFAVLDIWISMSTVNAARSLVLAVGRRPTPNTGVPVANGCAKVTWVRVELLPSSEGLPRPQARAYSAGRISGRWQIAGAAKATPRAAASGIWMRIETMGWSGVQEWPRYGRSGGAPGGCSVTGIPRG